MGHYVETPHLFCDQENNEFYITQSTDLFFPEECHNITSDNRAIRDETSATCVEIPLYNETEGVHELFSLNVGGNCVNNSRIAVSMHLNTTTTGITCGHKIGILTHDSTRCDGLTACKVNPNIFTDRKRSLRRLCFYTCLPVILFTGGGSASVHAGIADPPEADTPQ